MAKKLSEKQKQMAQKRKLERKAAAQAAKKKRRRKKILITTGICAAAAVLIAGTTVWTVKTSPLTHLILIKKTTNYSLNAAELTFYSWQIYQQYMQNATDSSSAPSTDTPLSEQNYDSDTTWEEYFAQAGCDYADNLLILCEAANQDGFEPDYDIAEEAENALTTLDLSTVPDFVKEEDITHAIELYLYAWEYHEYVSDNIELTDDDLEAYYEENAYSMQVCSYISFGFSYSDSEDGYLTSDEAEKLAYELRRCTTRESFEQWVVDYYLENTSLSEEEAEEYAGELYSEDVSYVEGDSISAWVFSEGVQAGDTQVITDSVDSTIYVCLLLSEPERDESNPVDLRQILLTSSTYGSVDDAHTQAEELLSVWESSEMTEDYFAALADAYSEDTSADGGLYTGVTTGQLLTSWKQWLLDSLRQEGDVTILDSSYGSCLVYYIGVEDTTSWEQTASEALLQDRYDELYAEYEADADVKTYQFLTRLIDVLRES